MPRTLAHGHIRGFRKRAQHRNEQAAQCSRRFGRSAIVNLDSAATGLSFICPVTSIPSEAPASVSPPQRPGEGTVPVAWSADTANIYVATLDDEPDRILKLNLRSGQSEIWKTIAGSGLHLSSVVAAPEAGAFTLFDRILPLPLVRG